MPAIQVDDLSTLPRLKTSSPQSEPRRVRSITTAPMGFEGEGFPVRRAFAGVDRRLLDPFVHMDQMGEVLYAPGEAKGTAWHPHRGFETVTYIMDGTFQHQDSNGGGGVITNGDTQWMTAGGGILHIERPPDELVASGGVFHGIQLWVNLPARDKMTEPRYQDIRANSVGLLTSATAGSLVRVIAGDVDGHQGPGITHTPITMMHVSVPAGERIEIPSDPLANALVYALAGKGRVGAEQIPFDSGELAVLAPGDSIVLSASESQDQRSSTLEALVLEGRPIGEPVVAHGPFVMNTPEEIRQAFADYEAGRLGTIPADHIG